MCSLDSVSPVISQTVSPTPENFSLHSLAFSPQRAYRFEVSIVAIAVLVTLMGAIYKILASSMAVGD